MIEPNPDVERSLDADGTEPERGWEDEVEAYEEYSLSGRWLRREASRRATRRGRGPVFRDPSEEPHGRIVGELADATGPDGGLKMTYKPARYEAVWLQASLRSFYEQELIVDVLAQVKGGKEANVYRCAAHPRTGAGYLAAKVYRPRKFRNLANDKLYREGRAILTGDGRPVKTTDHRIMRAIGKKTAFGVQVAHTSWLMHEYTTLEHLRADGAAVPRPFAANENSILMDYLGDARRAAPSLQEVHLRPGEARSLFREVLRNVELLLQHGLVHGDLSAYNILYWMGQITLIDFPQVATVHGNSHAHAILRRDVQRVCDYFGRQGVASSPAALAEELWERYGEPEYPE